MDWQRRMIPRLISGGLTRSICVAVALTVLFAAPDARSHGAQPRTAPATAATDNPFSRWFGRPAATPQAAAAPAAAAQPPQRIRKPRVSKSEKPTKPVAAQPAPAQEPSDPPQQQVAEPDWPDAAANVGGAMIAPFTIKTVREQVEPEPDIPIVGENEVSDIDRAAAPALAASATPEPAASTDGSGATEKNATEQAHVFAMGETMKAMMQSAWLEPLLLLLAGAIAAFSAARLFA